MGSRGKVPLKRVHLYVAAIIAAGGALLVRAALQDVSAIGDSYPEFWMLVALVAIGELLPIKFSNAEGDGDGEITASTIFTFAILLRFGTWPAILAQAIASAAADLTQRKPVWKASFNVCQYSLAVAAGGYALVALTGFSSHTGLRLFSAADLPGILVAGAIFFLLNNFLTRVAIALDQGARVVRFCREGLTYHAAINGILLALSPIAVVAAERSLALIPLLALPMAMVYRSASVYAEKEYKAHQALHDSLTGLPNRMLFYERMRAAIQEAQAAEAKAAVMLIDLDRFKEINDSLGHHIGDLLLVKVGNRLGGILDVNDTIARMGGDEFAVIIPGVTGDKHAGEVAARIIEALTVPFEVEEVAHELTLEVEASIGVVVCPDDGSDVDVLMQRADVAMYSAKEARNGFEFYSPDRDQHSPKQLALLGDLRRAIDDDELVLHYQPKADIATGLVVGVEALLRWQHPRRGLIRPDEFVPQAERTNLIHALTRHTINKSLAQVRRWNEVGLELHVAVNLSRPTLLNLHFPQEMRKILAEYDLPASCLDFEITESSIMADPQRAQIVLTELDDMGIGLSLDDFGAGYSSLSYLKRLPVREIKIDKSFVIGMLNDENDHVIVRSIVDLARNLGLSVVAEGVESAASYNELRALGCDMAQGFWLAEPMAPEEVPLRIAHLDLRGLGRVTPLNRTRPLIDSVRHRGQFA